LATALATSGCSKRYTEIEVRDPGRVGVGVWNERGSAIMLPPDGSQRVVRLPVPGVVAMRGHEVAIGWGGEAPVTLIDERGVLPRTPPGPGIEIRERRLWAFYNVTPKQVYPQTVQPDDSVPIVLTTEMTNVVDAREVREVRHWPAYVLLPAGILFAVLGTVLLSSHDKGSKVGGGVYLAGSVPLLVFGVLNLTSSNEVKPLAIPGGPPPNPSSRRRLAFELEGRNPDDLAVAVVAEKKPAVGGKGNDCRAPVQEPPIVPTRRKSIMAPVLEPSTSLACWSDPVDGSTAIATTRAPAHVSTAPCRGTKAPFV
jgi:hypothetical protein